MRKWSWWASCQAATSRRSFLDMAAHGATALPRRFRRIQARSAGMKTQTLKKMRLESDGVIEKFAAPIAFKAS